MTELKYKFSTTELVNGKEVIHGCLDQDRIIQKKEISLLNMDGDGYITVRKITHTDESKDLLEIDYSHVKGFGDDLDILIDMLKELRD